MGSTFIVTITTETGIHSTTVEACRVTTAISLAITALGLPRDIPHDCISIWECIEPLKTNA